MKPVYSKTAAILAFVIGAMAIVAGGKVLLGQDPGYYVISWLPVYNFSMGLITAGVTAVLIWKRSAHVLHLAGATLAIHSAVMIIIQTGYRQVVASESIQAMTIRIITWTIILALLLVGTWKTKTSVSRLRSL